MHRARARALAVALLLAGATSHAQTSSYCATNLGGACGNNDITALSITGTTLNATGLTCTAAGSQAYTAYPATGATTATLSGGVPYTLSATLSGASIVSVWVDYNHNFVFDASEWTQVTTNSPTSTPVSVQLLVPVGAVQGQTALRIRSRSAGSPNGAADACTQFFSGETKDFTVTIGAPAACPVVTGVSVTGITATGATLGFTPGAGAGSYTVTVTPAGGAPTTLTPAPTGSPVALAGLTAGTAYTVSIVGNCGGANGSSGAATVSFTTACVAAPYATVNNTTAYNQDFEATWLSQCGTKDAPGVNWRNTPTTGDNSWRREDDGVSANWTSTSGGYTPAGSPLGGTSAHSARFHTYDTPEQGTGLLDLYVNMAGTLGTPTLSFDHINISGSDSLKVYVSTNGGGTFTAAPVAAFTTASTWTRRTVALPTGLTATTIIRLRASSDYGFSDMGVDNVSVTYISCPPVTAASVTGVTTTGATLSFTPGAGAGSYTVTVTPAGGAPATQTATSSPVALAGLTAGTAYTVSIVGNCGGANGSSSAVTLTFITACAAAPYATVNNTTAYTQDFEAAWLSLCGTRETPAANWRNLPTTGDNSWRREDDGASANWTSTSGGYSPASSPLGGATGAHSARFHSYGAPDRSTGQLDLSVNMAGTVGTPTLNFNYINTSGADSLRVTVSTNGGTTFGPALAVVRTAATWTAQTVTLPTTGLTATTVIRFTAFSDFGFTDIGLDNVRVSYISCPPVTGVSVSNITTTGAVVDFTASAGGVSYVVTVTPAGGTASSQSVTTSPVTLTGLTPSTLYTVSIVTSCGTGNGNSTAVTTTFRTDCTAAPYVLVNNATPYTQDFEATWLSLCDTREVPGANWRNTPTTGSNSWRRDDDGASAGWTSASGSYTPAGSPLGGGTSAHSARFHSYGASNRSTGQLDLFVNMAGTAGTPTLNFDYINTSGADSLRVLLSTDGGVTFRATALTTLRTAAAWTRQTVALPAAGLTATTVIRLLAFSDFGFTDIGLDNLRLGYVTCPALTAVTATNVTSTGATINFTAVPGGASYTVTVTPAGGTASSQTVTTSPATLTGLTANTTYSVSVVVNCGTANGNSTAVATTFATDCAAAPYVLVNNATPYTQDFEATWQSQCGTREIPAVNWRGRPVTGNNSWRRDDDGGSANWTSTSGDYTPTSSPVGGATGTHSARFHSYDTDLGLTGRLDLYVNLAGTGAAAGLTFDYLNTSGTDSLQVLVSVNGGNTFGPALVKLNKTTAWARQTVALPVTAGATTVIRFLAVSDFGFTDIGLDNVRVTYSACLPVSGLTATNVTSTGAQLSFTPPAGAPAGTTYEIEYGPQGFMPGTGTAVTGLTSPTYALINLTQNRAYCFYVRQNCGTATGTSSYTGPTCFTTPIPVPANDDPCGAVALSTTATTATNVGATTSTQAGIALPTCSGSQLPKDVWFSFTAPAASMPLTVTGTAAGVVRVFSSPSCSAGPFAQVFCKAGPGNNQNVGAVTVTGLTVGSRYYLAVSGYGSSDTGGSFTIGAVATATKAQADTEALLVYPNPSNTGQLTLRLSGQTGAGQATLLNALGQVVASKILSASPEQTMSTRGLTTGLYTLRVTVASQVLTRKVMLE